MSFDYETMRLIWWSLLVLTIIGFSVCDGLLLGITMLLHLAGKTDEDRQTIIAGIAPTALGQQAWLLAAITVLFAAWPMVYAVFFSSLESVLLWMLLAWMIRPLGIFFRNSFANPLWRQNCDKSLTVCGFLTSALLGIISANLLKGIPFHLDSDMRIFFLGDFRGLFNPFALMLAALSVALLSMYGACFLQLKHSNEIHSLSKSLVLKSGLVFFVLFALAGLWITHLEGYHINSEVFPNGASNPLNKFVKRSDGLWLDNYEHEPGLWAVPSITFVSCLSTLYLSRINRSYWAFLAATVTVVFTVLTLAVSMFPFILPSNRSLNTSLTIWDASASQNVLSVLLWVAACALPFMAIASRWAFRIWSDNSKSGSISSSVDPFSVNHMMHKENHD